MVMAERSFTVHAWHVEGLVHLEIGKVPPPLLLYPYRAHTAEEPVGDDPTLR